MDVNKSFQKIRQEWISKVSQKLATEVGIQQSFQEQLFRYYDLTVQAVETNDPDWLNPLLDEWIDARTISEPGERASSLVPMFDQIFTITTEVARKQLSEGEALELLRLIIPVYTHSISYTAIKETNLYIDQVYKGQEAARVALEQVDKSKSDFIAIAAHELKTPLTLIEGYTAMLQEQLQELDGHIQVPILLKGIYNGTHRLREIVNDMIDVSMIDNDLLTLNYQPVWINRFLETIIHECQDSVNKRKQTLEIKPFPGRQEMTFADEERLYQALQNIISNSIKYTPDGGIITIDGRILPGFIEIIIKDTGIGINLEDQDIIFEKFGRLGKVSLHSTGKTKYKGGGPGLGLPITRGIIEAHGGTIWVESEGYDEVNLPGTTFHILLPLYKKPPEGGIVEMFRASVKTSDFGDLYAKRLESSD